LTRVVAGEFRGRRLHTLAGGGTRPTAERAREGLFSWLGARIQGAVMLDLFAGTGAIGIEALSRGAEYVTFVERTRAATSVLRRNLSDLGLLERTRLLKLDTRGALSRLGREGRTYDLVFADPPYGEDWGPQLADDDSLVGLLAAGGLMLLERASKTAAAKSAFLELKGTREYGDTSFDWYEPAGESGA